VSRALSFPFDTLKTLAQADTRGNTTVLSQEGGLSFRQYFRGVLPIILGAIPAQATFFTTYHILEVWTNCLIAHAGNDGISMEQVKFLQRLTIAALASLPTNVFKVPVEVWKQDSQLSNSSPTFKMFLEQATAEARREEAEMYAKGETRRLLPAVGASGLGGIYRGGNSMLLREIPYTALQFSCYGALSEAGFFSLADNSVLWVDTLHQSVALHSAVVGTIAAALATLGTQPADVIKTRMMTSKYAFRERKKQKTYRVAASSAEDGDTSRASAGIMESVKELYSARGLAGFYVGLQSRLALTTIGGFVFFGVSSYMDSVFGALRPLG
jgi:solute carrier family 25 S-adenosylmethionine transporter 26